MLFEDLTDDNFQNFCSKCYENPQCISVEEFYEDINRIKYIKKLITRYLVTKVLNERRILNHLIILNNVFGATNLNRIVAFNFFDKLDLILPFLDLLNLSQIVIKGIRGKDIYFCNVIRDEVIENILKEI